MFKKLGNDLLKRGGWFLFTAFRVKTVSTTNRSIEILIESKTGITKDRVWQSDRTYFYTDLQTIKDILKYDLVDERKYESEIHDCDDYAEVINARFRSIYRINTMGVARYIDILKADTGEKIGAHRANVFVAKDGNELKVFYLEPQTDQIVELNSKEVIIGSKKYVLNTIDF